MPVFCTVTRLTGDIIAVLFPVFICIGLQAKNSGTFFQIEVFVLMSQTAQLFPENEIFCFPYSGHDDDAA